MKICVYSSHQGSNCWQKLLQILNDKPNLSVKNHFLVSDADYRVTSGVIERFFLRIKIYFLYPIKIIVEVLFFDKKNDINLVITSPFFLPYIFAFLPNHTPFIILHNDIFPEALVQAQLISPNSIFKRIFLLLRKFAIKKAVCNIFISENHRQIVESTTNLAIKSSVIPVGAIGNIFLDQKIQQQFFSTVSILYCGTLGLIHDYSTIISYLLTYDLDNSLLLEFKISGAGRIPFENEVTTHLYKLVEAGQLIISNPIPDALWIEKMKSSSVGLILQSKGGEDIIFPSKFFGILVSGQAVLAISSLESELAKIVLDNDCGWIIEPGDLVGLHRVFQEIQIPEVLATKRRNAYNLGHSQYSIESLSIEWIEQLNSASLSNPDV